MDTQKYWEKKKGMPFGEIVRGMRNEGMTMPQIAGELGVALGTLYNALKRTRGPGEAAQDHPPDDTLESDISLELAGTPRTHT